MIEVQMKDAHWSLIRELLLDCHKNNPDHIKRWIAGEAYDDLMEAGK